MAGSSFVGAGLLADVAAGAPDTLTQWALFGADAVAKSLLVLLAAWVTVSLMRRSSSARRHMVWSAAVVSILLVPLLSQALPQFHVPLPGWSSGQRQPAPASVPVSPVPQAPGAVATADGSTGSAMAPKPAFTPMGFGHGSPGLEDDTGAKAPACWPAWVLGVWLAGAAALSLPLLAGTAVAARRIRRAQLIQDSDWLDLMDELRQLLGVKRRVRLLRSDRSNIPITCGILRPVILLPSQADAWPVERRRAVLLHELAHVRRCDCLTQTLAALARVLYWPNPLVWYAVRRLRIERERACDDMALSAGQKPSDYARHLLDVVRSLRAQRWASLAVVAMAQPSQFEGRLLAILDPRRDRRTITRTGIAIVAAILLAVAVPLASLSAAGSGDELTGQSVPHGLAGAAVSSQPSPPTQAATEPVKELSMQTPQSQPASPDRVNLDSVPHVGFYRGGNPEEHPLPSVMRGLMEYLGDDVGLPGFKNEPRGGWQWDTCGFFHGIAGSSFAFSWEHVHGDDYIGRRRVRTYEDCFAAAGYAKQTLLRSTFAATQDYAGRINDDRDEYRRLIVESIRDRRRPVVAIGLLRGELEPCLITGYEQDGAVLIGWNRFTGEIADDPRLSIDELGRFVLHDWFGDQFRGIVVPGEKLADPLDRRVAVREALQRDLALLCSTGTKDDPFGIMAWQAWIECLLTPVPEDVANDPIRLKPLHMRHGRNIGELAERRAYATSFVRTQADLFPQAKESLIAAGCCYGSIHDLQWRVWQTLGPWNKTDDAKLLRFARPEFRLELASLVRRMQVWDLQAAGHIRQALLAMGVSESQLPALPALPPVAGLRDLGLDRPYPGSLCGGDEKWHAPVAPVLATAQSSDVSEAVRAATAATRWPIAAPPSAGQDLRAWAASTGWEVRVVEVPPDEKMLPRVQRFNDAVLSCLYGLPIATTYKGQPAVIIGYDHLASETFRVRLAGQPAEDEPARIRMRDEGWGPTWVYLTGRTAQTN